MRAYIVNPDILKIEKSISSSKKLLTCDISKYIKLFSNSGIFVSNGTGLQKINIIDKSTEFLTNDQCSLYIDNTEFQQVDAWQIPIPHVEVDILQRKYHHHSFPEIYLIIEKTSQDTICFLEYSKQNINYVFTFLQALKLC